MEKSPLQAQFDQFDKDQDGKINANEALELLKLLGKNAYLGSVSHNIRLINYQTESEYFTFPQFQEYYETFENGFKEAIWKFKYELLKDIKELGFKHKEEEHSAAPGMLSGAPKAHQVPFEGDVQITIGPKNQNYQNQIQLTIKKSPKQESKPYLKIVFQQNSVQEATKLEALIKEFHKKAVQALKVQAPQFNTLTDSFNVITNVAGNRLNLFITTSSQDLINVSQLVTQYWDRILENKTEATVHLKYSFLVNIPEFLKTESDYSLYEMLTKNSHFKLSWSGYNFKEALKKLLSKDHDGFHDLKYDKSDPPSILLMTVLHTNLCQVELQFDNSSEPGNEASIKTQILEQLTQFVFQLSSWEDETSFNTLELISTINNKVAIEASIGDWKANLAFKIKDLNALFEPKPKDQ